MKEPSLFTADEFKKNLKQKASFAREAKKRKVKHEEKVQLRVCEYLKKKYPHVIFTCDLASGMNLGKKIGGMNTRLRSSRGLPDLFIAHPFLRAKSLGDGEYKSYHGLFIELKKEGTKIFTQKGGLVSDKHIQEQWEILERLKALGYHAVFACGYNEAVKVIDEYLV